MVDLLLKFLTELIRDKTFVILKVEGLILTNFSVNVKSFTVNVTLVEINEYNFYFVQK